MLMLMLMCIDVITFLLYLIIIGADLGLSYVPPQVAVVAVAVVLLAILVVVGTKSATLVVTAAMSTLLVVMRTRWWSGIFTQSRTENLGLISLSNDDIEGRMNN